MLNTQVSADETLHVVYEDLEGHRVEMTYKEEYRVGKSHHLDTRKYQEYSGMHVVNGYVLCQKRLFGEGVLLDLTLVKANPGAPLYDFRAIRTEVADRFDISEHGCDGAEKVKLKHNEVTGQISARYGHPSVIVGDKEWTVTLHLYPVAQNKIAVRN